MCANWQETQMASFEKRGNRRAFLGVARVELPMAKIGQFCSEARLPGSSKNMSLKFLLSKTGCSYSAISPTFSPPHQEPLAKLSPFCGGRNESYISLLFHLSLNIILERSFSMPFIKSKCHSTVTASTRNHPLKSLNNIFKINVRD